MNRYLLFDSGCAVCSDLAEGIERESGGTLTGRGLYDKDMQALLKRANPDWKFEPTLLEVDGDKVKAYTGLAMRTRMLTTMSPRRVYKIARLVQRAGVPLFGTAAAATHEPEAHDEPLEADVEPVETKEHDEPEAISGFRLTKDGLELGAQVPMNELTTIKGEAIQLSPQAETNTLLLFLSTTCPSCVAVASQLEEFAADSPEQVLLVFGAAKPDQVDAFIAKYHLEALPVVISPEARTAFEVQYVPYGYALDQTGTIRGKGIVNNNDHLDSLATTLLIGVDSIKQLVASMETNQVIVS